MHNDNNTTYVICECGVEPSDVSMDIINEQTVEIPTTGDKSKVVTANTTLQSMNVENWNKRIYGDDVLMPAIDNDGMIQNDLKKGQWMGEFGHPLDTTPHRQMTLNPPTVSHRILKYWKEGNLLKGTVQTVPYGWGNALANNALNGVPWAFSLRSLGSIDMATHRVKSPLKVITYDSVYRPSHIEAYGNEILSESATESGIYVPTQYNMDQIMNESCMVEPLHESFNINDFVDAEFIQNRSKNFKIISDMFDLNESVCVLDESGTRMNITMDSDNGDKMRLSVPVESVISIQYADVLNSLTKKF